MFPYFWNTMPPFLRLDFFKYLEIPFLQPFKRVLKSQCLITQFFVTRDLKALCRISDCHIRKHEREFAMLLLSAPELTSLRWKRTRLGAWFFTSRSTNLKQE